jgi:hypothetical protein
MATAMTADQQHQRLNVLAYDQSDEREHRIRDMAKMAVKRPDTYEPGGLRMPYLPGLPSYLDPGSSVSYQTLYVQLIPALAHWPKAAQLIAEEILRDQIERSHD